MKKYRMLFIPVMFALILSSCQSAPVIDAQVMTPVFIENAPESLGTITHGQYTYSVIHQYDYDSCKPDPYVCPDIYHAFLTDVYSWLYVQTGQTTWLDFTLDSEYKIKAFEQNDDNCAVTPNTAEKHRVGITCKKTGEYRLRFSLVDEQQQVYPLILHLISIPDLTPPPATIPPDLRVEEYELVQHPDVEPLSFKPITGSFSEILGKYTEERGQGIAGGKSVQLQAGPWIRAEEISQATGQSDPSHVINIVITQNETKVFEIQTPVSPITAFRGLWAIENHWFAEIAAPQNDSFRSLAKGDIFENGISLNETHDYSESFGFQRLGGKPFYFFERFGRVGVSYAGQEIPLGYERVIHYECCSAGELNPRVFENMVGFFAARGEKWYYVEVGIWQDDAPSPTPFSIPFSQFEEGGWRYLRDEQGLAYWHFPELPGIIFRNNGIRYEKTPSPAHMAPLPPIVTIGLYVEIYPRPESQIDTIRCGTSPFLKSIHNEVCTHFFRDIVVFSPGGAPLETKPCGGGGGQDGFLEKDGFLATSEGLAVCLKAKDELPFARQEQGEILDWLIELQTSEDLGLEGPIRLWVPLYYQTELGG